MCNECFTSLNPHNNPPCSQCGHLNQDWDEVEVWIEEKEAWALVSQVWCGDCQQEEERIKKDEQREVH